MILRKKLLFPLSVLMTALAVSGCTRSISNVDNSGKTASPVFPSVSSATREEGAFISPERIAMVRPNMTKAQIYDLLGVPHFSEGVMRVKEWDYIFHFTKADKSVLTCQYKVIYDSSMKAQNFYFQPNNCLEQLVQKTPVLHRNLSASSLFAFGSAVLSSEGKRSTEALVSEIRDMNPDFQVNTVVVTGHTDRFGNAIDNEALSLARAEAVRSWLITLGLPAGSIKALGVGDSLPVVFCPGAKSQSVVNCLAPNRRVTVELR
ncbi:OmpA family protein [Citrobacter amalonaticus]|uniref:OmpA family protein n=1 Tax=Citrobacter amalonaticus TaxID=35703 RepID=UPI001A2E3BAF|nr:outer membrane protein assembly factor BamE [Citrobacter amalonaticus]HDQ2814062.1 outer membrane protein assembly factor BamE [Citrobacter amalonaticus]